MKTRHFLAAFTTSLLLSATPALAFPDDAAELSTIITQEYGGNANLYVADEEGDFRRMGCRGRTDLMQQLFDSGLDMAAVDPDARIAMFACAIYDEQTEFLQPFLTPEWLAEIDEKYVGRRPISPLMYAVGENNYELSAVLLANDPGYYFWRGGGNENLTREGQLLLGAYRARTRNKDRALQAFVEALPAELIADSRDDAFIDRLEDVSRGRNQRNGSGGGGGGGGGLLGGLGDLALGAALGGSPTDFLIASAASGALSGGEEQAGGAPAEKPAAGKPGVQASPEQRRLATYLYNVPYSADDDTARASLGLQLASAMGPKRGLLVQQVQPGGKGAEAGIQQGDLITTIAGMDVEHSVELYEALEQAAEAESYEVKFQRGTQLNTVSVATELVDLPQVAETGVSEAATKSDTAQEGLSQSSSVLEELERLADLRDRGVLSEEEFEVLKAEILSGS